MRRNTFLLWSGLAAILTLTGCPSTNNGQMQDFLNIVQDEVSKLSDGKITLPAGITQTDAQIDTSNQFAPQIERYNKNYNKTIVQAAGTLGALGFISCKIADCDDKKTLFVTTLTSVAGAGIGDFVAKRNQKYASLIEAAKAELKLANQRKSQAQKSIILADDLIDYYATALPKYKKQLQQKRISHTEYHNKIDDLIKSTEHFENLVELEKVHLAILRSVRDDIKVSIDKEDDSYYAALDAEVSAIKSRIAKEGMRQRTLEKLLQDSNV